MRAPGNLSEERRERYILKAKLRATSTRKQKLVAANVYIEKNHEVKQNCRRRGWESIKLHKEKRKQQSKGT